jgi:hypothetical protein
MTLWPFSYDSDIMLPGTVRVDLSAGGLVPAALLLH